MDATPAKPFVLGRLRYAYGSSSLIPPLLCSPLKDDLKALSREDYNRIFGAFGGETRQI